MSEEILAVKKTLHEKDLQYPAYVLGYNSKREDKNPFKFPEVLEIERIKIGSIPRPLTNEEKDKLRILGEKADKNDWHCWNRGHYRKWEEVD